MKKEEFTSKGSRDFRQRYEGTFGFYTTEEGKRILVNLTTVGERELVFTDAKRVNYRASADKGTFFEFLSPVKKLFSIDDDIYIIYRRPARQFQRGISEANTLIHKVHVDPRAGNSVTFKRLMQAFSEDAYNVKLRLAQYEKKARKTVLLSNMIAIVDGAVFVYKDVIGKVADKKIVLNDGLFRQEVIDCLRDNSIAYTVEVAA